MKLRKIVTVCAALCLALPMLFLSCKDDLQEADGAIKNITFFKIGSNEGKIDEVQGTIAVFIPYNDANPNQIDSLSAEAEFNGDSISPAPEQPRSYREPVTFTVLAKDKTKKEYVVTVKEGTKESNDIETFTLAGRTATISWPNVTATVPYNMDVSHITPTIEHSGELCVPAGPQDFTKPVVYTITSINGVPKEYTVNVVMDPNPNKDIEDLRILGPLTNWGEPEWIAVGVINQAQSKITVTLPYGPNHSNTLLEFTPEVTHTGVSYTPEGPIQFGDAVNNTVQYSVTSAAGGSPHTYDVTVQIAASNDCSITAFYFGSPLETTITDGATGTPGSPGTPGTINMEVLYGTDRVNVTPIIAHTGASYSPTTPQDFSGGAVTYTVTAYDGSYKEYLVSVTEAPSHFKEITSFKVNNFLADIQVTDDAHGEIHLTLPTGSQKTALSPEIVSTGASIIHNGLVNNGKIDFTNTVTYTVSAQNNSTRAYVVTIDIAKNTAKQIKTFVIPGQVVNTVINEAAGTILVEVPKYANRSALTPTITFIGSSVSPASGVVNDFSTPQTYTVTADNPAYSKDYVVTVISTVVTPPVNADTPGYYVTGQLSSGPDLYNIFDHDVRGYGHETYSRWVQLVWDTATCPPQNINRIRVYSTNGCLAGVYVTLFGGSPSYSPGGSPPVSYAPITTLPGTTPPGTGSNGRFYYPAAASGNYAEINLDSSIPVTGIKVELKLRQGWGIFRILQVYLDQIDSN